MKLSKIKKLESSKEVEKKKEGWFSVGPGIC